jgi:hypothetical protein
MSDVIKKFVGPLGYEACEKCHYEGGFHITLHPVLPESDGVVAARLKCPGCGQVYDFGLRLQQAEGWH